MNNIGKYIGKPYEGYDCFDLVKEFYQDNYDIDLKYFYEGDNKLSREQIETLIITNSGSLDQVEEPKLGDVVVIRFYGYACHIGIFLGEGQLLHSRRGAGSCIEPISRYKNMIEGFYRPKGISK